MENEQVWRAGGAHFARLTNDGLHCKYHVAGVDESALYVLRQTPCTASQLNTSSCNMHVPMLPCSHAETGFVPQTAQLPPLGHLQQQRRQRPWQQKSLEPLCSQRLWYATYCLVSHGFFSSAPCRNWLCASGIPWFQCPNPTNTVIHIFIITSCG